MKILSSIVFWDWNGTLLNDVESSVKAINILLQKSCMDTIETDYYKSVFGFPVKDYYLKLGFNFDKTSFEDLSKEFIYNYKNHIHLASLYSEVHDILKKFKKSGKKQIIVSAMENEMLQKQLKFFGVDYFFDAICGIDDFNAASKTYLAHNYINKHKLDATDILFIGDTLHDKEVADEIGCKVVLVANGHQSPERLRVNGNIVVDSLNSILE